MSGDRAKLLGVLRSATKKRNRWANVRVKGLLHPHIELPPITIDRPVRARRCKKSGLQPTKRQKLSDIAPQQLTLL